MGVFLFVFDVLIIKGVLCDLGELRRKRHRREGLFLKTAKQQTGKNAPPDDVIHEHIRVIDLENDFMTVARECRESSFYLHGLEELLLAQASPLEMKISSFIRRIRELEDSFSNLDESIQTIRLFEITEKLVPFVPQTSLDGKELYEITKAYIEIRASMDKAQAEIIEYLIGFVITKINKLVEKVEQLKPLQQNYEIGARMDRSFFHSIDVDKIVTYKFHSHNHELDREFKLLNINLSEFNRIRDYSVLIEQKRQQYRFWHDAYATLLLAVPKVQAEQELKIIESKQQSYSLQVTVLTYFIGALTLATLFLGGFSCYYAYKDHHPTIPINSGVNNGDIVRSTEIIPAN